MTLVKRNSDLFPSVFDEFFGNDFFNWNNFNYSPRNTTLPAVNIKEDQDEFEIEVAAPGLKKEDFQINLDNNLLTISSEMQEHDDEKKDNFTRNEFYYQLFRRSFTLPENLVDGNNINASYTDGILKIQIPKKEESKPKPPKQIEIS